MSGTPSLLLSFGREAIFPSSVGRTGEPTFLAKMAGFISDLLVGLPVPDDDDVNTAAILTGLRAALGRLN